MLSRSATFQRRSLILSLVAFALALIAWNVPQLDFLLYPLRLFVTFVHEAGHGLAALLTGGQIGRLHVYPNGAGVASTGGGLRWVILPAGYLGAALFGAGLFYLANRIHHTRAISVTLGALIALIAVLYTDLFSLAFVVGALMGAGLIGLGLKANEDITLLVLNFLAVITGLNAVFDLFGLIRSADMTMGTIRNDAAAFSAEVAPLVPPVVWALLWAGLALLILGAAVYYGAIKPRLKR